MELYQQFQDYLHYPLILKSKPDIFILAERLETAVTQKADHQKLLAFYYSFRSYIARVSRRAEDTTVALLPATVRLASECSDLSGTIAITSAFSCCPK